MKKVLCLVVACILAIVFLSAPSVSAVTFKQIKWTDWDTKATIKTSNSSTGEHTGSSIGQGILVIESTEVLAQISVPAHVSLNPLHVDVYMYCQAVIQDLTFVTDVPARLEGATCVVVCYDKNDTQSSYYSGPCVSKLIFTSETSFEGKIKFTTGGEFVKINMKGKKISDYPTP
jgi:hypothetical protein